MLNVHYFVFHVHFDHVDSRKPTFGKECQMNFLDAAQNSAKNDKK